MPFWSCFSPVRVVILCVGASVGKQPSNFYWWVDVEFVPFEDNRLLVSFGGYLERLVMSPVPATRLHQGRILSWQLTAERSGKN